MMRGGSKNIHPERGNHYNVSIMDRNERRSVVMALLLAVGCRSVAGKVKGQLSKVIPTLWRHQDVTKLHPDPYKRSFSENPQSWSRSGEGGEEN